MKAYVKLEDKTLNPIINKTIEQVIATISQKQNIPMSIAQKRFMSSSTYKILCDPSTKMWTESTPYIYNEYAEEASPATVAYATKNPVFSFFKNKGVITVRRGKNRSSKSSQRKVNVIRSSDSRLNKLYKIARNKTTVVK